MQEFLGLLAVSRHVVMIGPASAIHLMDRFDNVFVNGIEIVPVSYVREGSAGQESQAEGCNRKSFLLQKLVPPGSKF